MLSIIITWLCDILALVWHFGPACVRFRPGLCDILALSCVTKASACHHTPISNTGAVYRKFHRSSVSKTTLQLSSNSTESSPIRVIVSELSWPHLNTSIWKVQGIASRAQRPLTTALWDNNFPSLRAPRDVTMGVACEMALASTSMFVIYVGNTDIHGVKLKMPCYNYD